MNEQLQKYAVLAEVISALAVVVTLIFLLIGIRDNTAINKAQMFEKLLSDINQHNLTILQDPDLSRIWFARSPDLPDTLSEDDLGRLNYMYRIVFRIYDAAFYSNRYGFLGEGEWARIEVGLCGIRRSMADEMWRSNQDAMSGEFIEFVEKNC